MRICENCGIEHEGEYGSGRFCSTKCARCFSTKKNRKEINEKVSNTFKERGITKEGLTVRCKYCNEYFTGSKTNKNPKFCSQTCVAKYNMKVSDDEIIKSCKESLSMGQAAELLGVSFLTLRKRAKNLGVYQPNVGLKGTRRKSFRKIQSKEILEGKHPNYQTHKLKKRLLKEGIKENKCERCGISIWQEIELCIELHHIDGNNRNHKLNNLQMLCPNCHSLTVTYKNMS